MTKLIMPAVVAIACSVLGLSAGVAVAAPGDLDPAFGSAGKTIVNFGGDDDARAEALQSDGKLVVVGDTTAGATQDDFAVTRLNSDGTLDSAFGTGGKTLIDFGGDDDGFAVALESDGKIVVAGRTTGAVGAARFAVARLNSDGTLDTSFGTGGETTVDFGGTGAQAQAVVVQVDGKIVLAGTSTSAATQGDFAVARLNSDGTPDASFGTGGRTTVDLGGDDHAFAVALQSDGRIDLAGDSAAGTGVDDFAAARLNSDGSLDASFGTAGTTKLDFGGADDAVAETLQSDGKLVLVGDTTAGAGGGDMAVARLAANGTPDPAFGTGGKTTIDFGGQDIGRAVALQPDGEILVAGAAANVGAFAVARLQSNGALDPSFGTGGKTTLTFAAGDDAEVVRAVTVQPDGKIVLAGVGGGLHFAIARLTGGGGGPGGGGGTGGASGAPPPAPNCGTKVASYVSEQWRCLKAGAPTSDSLVLSASDVPGFRPAGQGPRVIHAALGNAIPARRLAHAHASGAAFRSGPERLSLATFTLASPAAATRALRARQRGFHPLAKLGEQAALDVQRPRSRTRPTTAIVLVRVGRGVAVVRLTVPRQLNTLAAALAERYAAAAALRLQHVLTLTPWQRTLDQVSPTGSFSPQVALRAFAIAYGSLPGVPPQGATGPGSVPDDSATVADQMIAAVWNRLTRAQQAAIDDDLGAPHDAGSPRVARAADDIPITPNAQYTAIANKYVAIYHAKLPTAPVVPVKAFTASQPRGTVEMDSLPSDAKGNWGPGAGPEAYCRVRVFPQALQGSAVTQEREIAHEVFHCFEFVLSSNWPAQGQWVMDGLAEWGAQTVDPVPPVAKLDFYSKYLANPGTPLFARTYDAIGFWFHADEAGGVGSLWSKVPAILNVGSAAAYVLAGGTNQNFIDTWASGTLRLSAGGPPWNQTRPYPVSPISVPSPTAVITEGAGLASSPYALDLAGVSANPEAPMVSIIPLSGRLRAATKDAGDLNVLAGQRWFCMGGDCKCPPGSDGTVPDHQNVSSGIVFLALTGGDQAGAARISYHRLDEFCQDEDTGGGGGGGGGGKGGKGIDIFRYTGNGVSQIGTISTGSCGFGGSSFHARGSGDGFTMNLRIAGAKKPGTFPVLYGSRTTFLTVGRYSSTHQPPGLTIGGYAIVRVYRVKKVVHYRLSLGFANLLDASLSSALALRPAPGGLVC